MTAFVLPAHMDFAGYAILRTENYVLGKNDFTLVRGDTKCHQNVTE